MDASEYREEIYDVFVGTGGETENQIRDALELGAEYLGLSVGFLTQIDDDVQTIVQAVGTHELLQPGETCPLEEAYCRQTIETDQPLAVQQVDESAAISRTAAATFELETYIGTKVVVDDELYGTVCFADESEREIEFSEAEKLFLELLARLVGQALERRAHEQELRRRNEQLEREKRRFERIAETSFDILFQLDTSGRFTYVSSAAERILGVEPAALTGVPFVEHLVDSSVETAKDAYAQVLDDDPVRGLELEFRSAGDEIVILEVNAIPVRTDDGTVTGVQGVGRDVTEKKERERELHLKDRAMDDAEVGISIADNTQPNTPLVYVNGGFERLTGYESEDVLGRNCRFLQGEETDPAAVERLSRRLEAGDSVSVELLNYRNDGMPFWNQVRISPVVNDAGDVTHQLGFQTDVTERKRTEQLVKLLNRVLRHNLRNDMNLVLGYGRLLQEDTSDEHARLGERIESTAADLVTLSEQARRLEQSARQDRTPERVDPKALLTTVRQAYEERFPEATIECSIRTDRAFCAGAELERAVAELVENGLKHDPDSQSTVTLTVTDDDEWLTLTVDDTGPGIDEMERAVITNGNETALEHGSGLGLWLVNWIVTRYGGSFQIRATTDDTGSKATVKLPAIGSGTTVEEATRRPTVLFR